MMLKLVQLVNKIGKKLEQIALLDDSQKTDVLSRAQRGGFIRWHILNTEQKTISLTYRDDRMNVFSVSVGLEVSFLSPDIYSCLIIYAKGIWTWGDSHRSGRDTASQGSFVEKYVHS